MDASVDWSDWRVVHMAWKTGSFTAAAEQLGCGQATVSRRIAAVEEALGTALFDRHRSGLVPTRAAEAVLPHLEGLAAAADGAERAVAGLEVRAAGWVRVAMPPGIAVDWAGALADWLSVHHPDVHLEVLADVTPRDLDRREADLALRAMPTERGDLLVRRIGSLLGGVFATPSLVAGLPDAPTAADVPYVQWSRDQDDLPLARFIGGLFPHGPVFRTNDYLVLRTAIEAGVGAGVLGVHEAASRGLVEVPVDFGAVPSMPLYLVVHRALRQVPRVEAVMEGISALVEQAPSGILR